MRGGDFRRTDSDVNCRGFKRAMTKQALHVGDIRPVLDKVRCERMPPKVRSSRSLNARKPLVIANHDGNRLIFHRVMRGYLQGNRPVSAEQVPFPFAGPERPPQAGLGKQFLSSDETPVAVLSPLSGFTAAQLAQAHRFKPGMTVVFNRKSGLFKRGIPFKVLGERDGFVRVKNQKGETLLFEAKKEAQRISVFETKTIPIAPGEQLLIRRNGTAGDRFAKLTNGERVTVKEISKSGYIILEDGRTLPPHFRHFCHGYAVTGQSSQGKQVARVLISIDSETALASARQETLYVAASRGIERCTIFTDSKAGLLTAFMRSGERTSALEFVKQQQQQHPTEHYEKTKLTGTIPGHQQLNSIPKPGQFAYSPGVNSPDLCHALGGGDASQLGSLHHDPITGSPQNPFPDEPGICRRPGTWSELPEPSLYDSLNAELQACVA